MPIRDGSQSVAIYNDGLIVYLYDEAFLDRLTEMDAGAVVTGSDTRDEASELRRELIDARMMLAYELYTDNGVHCEVVVGKALSAKERRGRKWIKVQKALIDLPSGKLRVESANSCRLQHEEPLDEGQSVEVPPGEYLVSLFRVDPNFEEEDDWDDDDDVARLPAEVIVLTPSAEAKLPRKWDPFLTWAGATGVAPLRLPPNKIDGSSFCGSVLRDSHWVFTDATPQILRKMGVEFGDVLDVEVDDKTQRALYSGTLSKHGLGAYFRLGQYYGSEITPLLATLTYHDRQRQVVVSLDSWGGGSARAGKEARAITLRKRDERLVPRMDDSLLGTAQATGETSVRAPILLASPHGVLIDLGEDLLTRLGNCWNDPLQMEYGGLTREVQISNSVLCERDRFVAEVAQVAADDADRVAELADELDRIREQIAKSTTLDAKNQAWVELEERTWERHLLQVPPERRCELPIYGSLSQHPIHIDRGVLWLQPLIGGAFFQDFTVGESVVLSPSVSAATNT